MMPLPGQIAQAKRAHGLHNVCVPLRLNILVMTKQKFTLPITGMTCANCAANIERGVKKLKGVADASVNFAAESAAVTLDPQQLQLQDVVEQIQKAILDGRVKTRDTLLADRELQEAFSQ